MLVSGVVSSKRPYGKQKVTLGGRWKWPARFCRPQQSRNSPNLATPLKTIKFRGSKTRRRRRRHSKRCLSADRAGFVACFVCNKQANKREGSRVFFQRGVVRDIPALCGCYASSFVLLLFFRSSADIPLLFSCYCGFIPALFLPLLFMHHHRNATRHGG